MEQAACGDGGLITALRCIPGTFGVSEEPSSDGGLKFTTRTIQTFLKNYGIYHHSSSVAFAHSMSRAEIKVMRVKWLITEHTCNLQSLAVGDTVRIQNRVGTNPTKWHKTGIIFQVSQFDQYIVSLDGSGCVAQCNPQFLITLTLPWDGAPPRKGPPGDEPPQNGVVS